MIDPGHGGYDPGTQSSAGVAEKDLALQIATRLKAALEARGIRAELTRSTDVFISLAERTRIANSAGADLFVSIHLNSSPNPDTTGIEVYYLNNTTDRATIRLARMENGGADGYGAPDASNLNYILTDLRQNYKASEAASLAKMIDAQTVADLDAGLGLNVNALGAKMGPFYVLVGAHMPAVLVECGFMSNAVEARPPCVGAIPGRDGRRDRDGGRALLQRRPRGGKSVSLVTGANRAEPVARVRRRAGRTRCSRNSSPARPPASMRAPISNRSAPSWPSVISPAPAAARSRPR